MGMIVKQPRWLQGLYRRHFFALEAIFLALLAVTSISSCPRKCQCIWRDSKITVDCSDQELAAIPTTVEANTQVSNNIHICNVLTYRHNGQKCAYTGSLAPADFSGAVFTCGHFQKIDQISSLYNFHYISKGIPSLMRFWLIMA